VGKALSELSREELWQLFPIILKDHNPAYKEWYQAEKDELIHTVGQDKILRINHIGSSAVAGLISKPTIDILIEVGHDCNIEGLKSTLCNTGWTLMSVENEPSFKLSFNKGYTPNGFAEKVFHLHVRYLEDWNELYFRDYLLAHRDVAEEYGKLKQKLKEQYEHDRDAYTNAKTEFITRCSQLARKEFGACYAP
jgi:GrpB-like predicted nucleotidyltransferase (UPF0157 family)